MFVRDAQTKVDRRPTGFDEAYMPLRRARGNRQVQLRMAAPLTLLLQ